MYDPLKAKTKLVAYTAVMLIGGMGIASGLGWTSPSYALPGITEAPQVSPDAVRPALDLSDAFKNLADAVTPAVVRIESRRMVRRQDVPEQFRRFFDENQQGPPQSRIAGGSGFVVSPDGYILTNAHVVENSEGVRVHFPDRRYYDAEIVGADPFTDVAVLKIDADEDLHAMALGNSDEISVGEWILAIGNPGLGSSTQLDFTVTAGIISARGRGLQLLQRELSQDPRYANTNLPQYAIEDFIQTDAVINPGNSGGPMVNLRGQVVGINSAIASTSGVYQGYGFAIPVNLARRIMEDLIEYGTVRRPRLGVTIVNVSAEDAEVYNLPSISGILVQTVPDDGPAYGILRPYDVIVALNDVPVGYVAELQAKIANHRPGDRVQITVYRDGSPMDIDIRLAEAPINQPPTLVVESEGLAEERLGIRVEAIDGESARELGLAPGAVVLSDVTSGSAAARRGVGQYLDDQLVRINDDRIAEPQDVREALSGVRSGQVVSLYFMNPTLGERVVNVRMPE